MLFQILNNLVLKGKGIAMIFFFFFQKIKAIVSSEIFLLLILSLH